MSQAPDRIHPLRPLDCTLVQAGAEKLLRLRDALGISPDALVPLSLFGLLTLFDGRRSVLDIQAEVKRQTGEVLPGADLQRLVDDLDKAYLLDSPRFRERFREVVEEWNAAPVRAAAHSGPRLCYPDDVAELECAMEEMYRREGAADPARRPSTRPLLGVLSPHIDFPRGGHVYTWSYREVRERMRAGAPPVFVIIGTCHQPMTNSFSVTRKSFATPWGPVPADVAFIERLEKAFGGDLRADEFQHKHEHSIEFQVVFLRHALGGRPFSIVPILCGGFHEAVARKAQPDEEPEIASFLDALASTVRQARDEGRQVVMVGGVDLAHVGQNFGDRNRLTEPFLADVRSRDADLLETAKAVDPRAFFAHIVSDGNARRVCGSGAIYTVMSVLDRARDGRPLAGDVLAYDQAVDAENDVCVSFASVAFEEKE